MLFVIVMTVFILLMYIYGARLFERIKRSSYHPVLKGFLYVLAGSAMCFVFVVGAVCIMLGFYRPPNKS